MAELPTNFKDDILAEAMGGRRRYQMIQNEDGTVSFVDVTEYEQLGSDFGQAEINQTNIEVNNKVNSADVVDPMAAEEEGKVADAKLTGDALRELNAKSESSLTVSIGGKVYNNILESYGKVVHLNFRSSGSVTGADVIAKIPEGYRPAKNIYPVGMGVADAANVAAVFEINVNGNIAQLFTGGTFSNPCVDVTYLID